MQPTLAIGTLTRPHGVRGAMRIRCDAEHVALLHDVVEAGLEVELRPTDGAPFWLIVSALRGSVDAPILEFAGITDRNAAEPLRGAQLAVVREALAELEDDEFYLGDLHGLAVHESMRERRIGTVIDVENLPANVVLTVQVDDEWHARIQEAASASADRLLVPLIEAAVPHVDVAARRIDIDLAFFGIDAHG